MDHTDALDHAQFTAFFAETVSAEVTLSANEWAECCRELGVEAAVGLPCAAALQFLEQLDDRAVRSIHSKVVGTPSETCPICGEGSAGGAGAAAAIYCSDEQRQRVRAMGCLCKRLQARFGDHILGGIEGCGGEHVGRRLLDLFLNEPGHVRALVRAAKMAQAER